MSKYFYRSTTMLRADSNERPRTDAMPKLKEHLQEVDETYFEHMAHASSFGFAMVAGGMACFLHALFPFAFVTTGSDAIKTLHDRMVVNRLKSSAPANADDSSTSATV